MASVTNFVKKTKQPRGGFIRPATLSRRVFNDGTELNWDENISPILVGLAVDLLSRIILTEEVYENLNIQMWGAMNVGEEDRFEKLADLVTPDLSDESIYAVCQLVGYDVAFRAGPLHYKPVTEICPDMCTINNIRIMVTRTLNFFKSQETLAVGFNFAGAFTPVINTGDADFLTREGIWDLKVSVQPPKKEHTLQILIYTLLAISGSKRGTNPIFDECSFKYMGLFNPRLHIAYWRELADIPQDVINEIKTLTQIDC